MEQVINKLKEEDIKNFEIQEVDLDLQKAEKNNTQVRCWVGTWNNPKMTDYEFCDFLDNLYERNILQYATFQREKGEECETEHFQFFINFKNAQRFTTIKTKEYLPYGCHFKPMYSNKTRCRDYCQKEDTRISKEYYEIGEFVEEGGRSDLSKIALMIEEGVPLRTLEKIYPTQFLQYGRQLKEKEQRVIDEQFDNIFRKLEVFYIWGKTNTGKTRYVLDKYGYRNVYRLKWYDSRAFDKYNRQDIIMFEEFRSSFKITDMLHYLDGYPLELPCRFVDKVACYTKVYIVTNIPLEQQYKNVQEEEKETYNAFKRRITKVYNFDDINDRLELLNGKTEQLKVDLIPLTEQESKTISKIF